MSTVPAFKARRLTSSTFLITEWDDIYDEHPFIYAKVVPSAQTMLILDTGCGGASNNPCIGVKSLREFLETVAVEENERAPLNPGGQLAYIVVQSHCHYDHIRRCLENVLSDDADKNLYAQWGWKRLLRTA
ncbi:hypothetical protein M404DRAFT_996897 [Pisolithus tinctorius Marx 270]|uniref:Metallo-beta-lactamase domain-containing protein n=1 Tax=Pisolithus tinctorius Marx 270 TaxID=870435 RepID=A0A0C3PLY6_PISTI|nr:hypothetical protein M404DRAFT_996897 [Pisolithus tinctorius Marx 270]